MFWNGAPEHVKAIYAAGYHSDLEQQAFWLSRRNADPVDLDALAAMPEGSLGWLFFDLGRDGYGAHGVYRSGQPSPVDRRDYRWLEPRPPRSQHYDAGMGARIRQAALHDQAGVFYYAACLAEIGA